MGVDSTLFSKIIKVLIKVHGERAIESQEQLNRLIVLASQLEEAYLECPECPSEGKATP